MQKTNPRATPAPLPNPRPARQALVQPRVDRKELVRIEHRGHPIAFWLDFDDRFVDHCEEEGLRVDLANGDLVATDGARRPLPARARFEGDEPPPWLSHGPGGARIPGIRATLNTTDDGHEIVSSRGWRLDALKTAPPGVIPGREHAWKSGLQLFDEASRPFQNVGVQDLHGLSRLGDSAACPEKVLELHRELIADRSFPHQMINEGCEARAHVICGRLANLQIPHAKVFVYGRVRGQDDFWDVFWWYHVAPVVPVASANGERTLWVIDPSLSEQPQLLSDWVAGIQWGPVVLDVVDPVQYSPRIVSARPKTFTQNSRNARVKLEEASSLEERLVGVCARVESVVDGLNPPRDFTFKLQGRPESFSGSGLVMRDALERARDQNEHVQVAVDTDERRVLSVRALTR